MNDLRLAVVSLWADDVSTTAHFYRDVLGLRLVPHHGATASPHFDLGGTYLILLKGQPRPAENTVPARFPLVAFAVEDLEAAVERLRAHGVALPWGVEEDAGSRWVMFNDPAGNLIELAQFKNRNPK
jgi:catechol 2,3-dioxygenase-like lactoylglutathione lyase family enzyme